MSDSAHAGTGRENAAGRSKPRALIHKKILEAAAADPEATMAAIADEVSGASTDLVERVLEEYGDPGSGDGDDIAVDGAAVAAADDSGVPVDDDPAGDGDDPTGDGDGPAGDADGPASDANGPTSDEYDPATAGTQSPSTDGEVTETDQPTGGGDPVTQDMTANATSTVASPDELTERERVVLEAIAERPSATQQELADDLGVSRATISKRANGIAGFDWQDRVAYVEQFFGESVAVSADGRGRPADGRVNGGAGGSTGGTANGGRSNGDGAANSADVPNDDEASADTTNPLVRGGSGSATVPGPVGDAATQNGGNADLGALTVRLDDVEDRLASLESSADTEGSLPDPALVHKVIHACMEADTVSPEEELRVIAAIVPSDDGA